MQWRKFTVRKGFADSIAGLSPHSSEPSLRVGSHSHCMKSFRETPPDYFSMNEDLVARVIAFFSSPSSAHSFSTLAQKCHPNKILSISSDFISKIHREREFPTSKLESTRAMS